MIKSSEWYRRFARMIDDEAYCMNHGFNDGSKLEWVHDSDQPHRFSLNLIKFLIDEASIDLRGVSVAEIGCGRGGNLRFCRKYRGAKLVVGLDRVLGSLRVVGGAAEQARPILACGEHLPLKPDVLDVGLCIEMAHLLEAPVDVLQSFVGCLKVGGHLIVADGVHAGLELPAIALVEQGSLEYLSGGDITNEVVSSLRARRSSFWDEYALSKDSEKEGGVDFLNEMYSSIYSYVLPRLESGVFEYKYFVGRRVL